MATASVTNNFSQGAATSGPAMNENFTDIESFMNNSVVHVDGSKSMTGNLDLNGNKLTDIGNPSASTDGVPKSYIDGFIGGATFYPTVPFTSSAGYPEPSMTFTSSSNDVLGWWDTELNATTQTLVCPATGIYRIEIYEQSSYAYNNGAHIRPQMKGAVGPPWYWYTVTGNALATMIQSGFNKDYYRTFFVALSAGQEIRFGFGVNAVQVTACSITIIQMGVQ